MCTPYFVIVTMSPRGPRRVRRAISARRTVDRAEYHCTSAYAVPVILEGDERKRETYEILRTKLARERARAQEKGFPRLTSSAAICPLIMSMFSSKSGTSIFVMSIECFDPSAKVM